jgi:hypothetical protein
LEQNARLFALINIAMADAAICAWDAKYAYNFCRPLTAIQNADFDGNPATEKDASWSSFIITPPFPEYVSGHSTFSGAASTVLARFYGTDEIAFITVSDFLPGVFRHCESFSAAANEAAVSRLYGGIHFRFSNEDGLDAGRGIGAWGRISISGRVEVTHVRKEMFPATIAPERFQAHQRFIAGFGPELARTLEAALILPAGGFHRPAAQRFAPTLAVWVVEPRTIIFKISDLAFELRAGLGREAGERGTQVFEQLRCLA